MIKLKNIAFNLNNVADTKAFELSEGIDNFSGLVKQSILDHFGESDYKLSELNGVVLDLESMSSAELNQEKSEIIDTATQAVKEIIETMDSDLTAADEKRKLEEGTREFRLTKLKERLSVKGMNKTTYWRIRKEIEKLEG